MCVGVDATFCGLRRGYGWFRRSIFTPTLAIGHKNDCVLFLDAESEEFPLPEGPTRAFLSSGRCGSTRRVVSVYSTGKNGRGPVEGLWSGSRHFPVVL